LGLPSLKVPLHHNQVFIEFALSLGNFLQEDNEIGSSFDVQFPPFRGSVAMRIFLEGQVCQSQSKSQLIDGPSLHKVGKAYLLQLAIGLEEMLAKVYPE